MIDALEQSWMLVLDQAIPAISNEITFVFQKNSQQSLVYVCLLTKFCCLATEQVCIKFLLPLNYVFKYLKQVKWYGQSKITEYKNGQVH